MSFCIKRHDRNPPLSSVLEAPADTAVNLSGATVKFIMTLLGASSAKVNAAATIVSATGGSVTYAWGASDTDTSGLYIAEWEVTFGDGTKRTFPENDYLYVNVVADLA